MGLRGRRILITGGTGLIGSALLPYLLQRGCEIAVLTRDPRNAPQRLPLPIRWVDHPASIGADEHYDTLINLAGESLAKGRWTAAKKRRLFASRIDTTQALLAWVERAQRKPDYLISASAVGFYGPRSAEALAETDAGTASFGHSLCAAWEDAAERFTQAGLAVTRLRLGVVFARSGGAFEQLRRPFDFRLATVMGAGNHYCSWIHRDDLLRVFDYLLTRPAQQRLTGAVNATAPEPLSYNALADQLAGAKGALAKVHLPPSLLRLTLGEMADELLLQGQRVLPVRLQQAGFQFSYPTFAEALRELLS
jgi:uncharacterized protein (TIGR01777 family)